ncbi:LysR family transcriptional regulator, partial [Streptomyces sp. TRM76130]|nr:LysR family transcriptional regulator [Streptomyces sp. TRM76130]
LAVVDHGNITAAAGALHVSQPSLSHAIKLLESDLGAELFHRMPRGVRPTPAGEAFAGQARRIVREMETGRAVVKAVTGLVAGRLDLIALPAVLLDPLASMIGRFRALHPEVRIRVTTAERPEEVREAVRSGAVELGLTDRVDPTERDLTGGPVTEQELVL